MYLKLARQVSTDKGTNLRAGKHSAKRADYGTIGLHNKYIPLGFYYSFVSLLGIVVNLTTTLYLFTNISSKTVRIFSLSLSISIVILAWSLA